MIDIKLICVGKLKEKFYADAVSEYTKRLGAYCKLTVLELPEERLPDKPSQAQIDAALEKEGERILSKIPNGAVIVPLCVEGQTLSSEALAERMAKWTVQGNSQFAFLIGGSFGMHPSVKAKANLRLSMSPMTFPHHLARVMVLEQIYRAFKINEGSSYHK